MSSGASGWSKNQRIRELERELHDLRERSRATAERVAEMTKAFDELLVENERLRVLLMTHGVRYQ